MTKQDLLRQLPSVDGLLATDHAQTWINLYGRQAVIDHIRGTIDTTRQHILNEVQAQVDEKSILHQIDEALERAFLPTLRPVINATGVIIHTNLGRALLSDEAQQAVQVVAVNYSNLEFNLETGKRGSRYTHAEASLSEITGAEAALVVNNNASALILVLSALARDRSVIISRGQLVEIGGGFRIPAIMEQSGAHLIEVGTTNRTRSADYAEAIDDNTALIMRIHSSNFRIIGFTEEAPLDEMATIAHRHDIHFVDDIGSGALLGTAPYGLLHEPTVNDSLQAGADLVLFSGDKLLGGPQAGIIVGKSELIQQLKTHPLARALRADKLCYAALSATLDHYRRDEVIQKIPIWQMISASTEELTERAKQWQSAIGQGELIDGQSAVGGGSLPGTTLPTTLFALDVPSAEQFTAQLRAAKMPIIARITDNRVLFDPRTVLPRQDEQLIDILKQQLS